MMAIREAPMTRRAAAHVAAIGALAGLAGGLAEVVWIWTYATLTNSDAALVARAVAQAVRFDQEFSPVVGGLAIHMGLAAVLGVAVALAIRSVAASLHGFGLHATVGAALTIVWAVNFLVVLPLVSPQFVDVVPYAVSLVSKILFGVAVAGTLQLAEPARARIHA
jgi:hypothetical protein